MFFGESMVMVFDWDVYILGFGKIFLLDVIVCRMEGKVMGKVYYNNYECIKEVIK